LVDGLVSDQGWQTQLSVGGVEAGWASVVGPAIAEHCHPEGFREGVLAVRAESTAWATQVRLLAPTVLARLAAELGDGVVTRIEVLGPTGPSWRKGRLRVPGRGPRDTYG
jgi:predicted nucleic acid-binding Zn ribbon protein